MTTDYARALDIKRGDRVVHAYTGQRGGTVLDTRIDHRGRIIVRVAWDGGGEGEHVADLIHREGSR